MVSIIKEYLNKNDEAITNEETSEETSEETNEETSEETQELNTIQAVLNDESITIKLGKKIYNITLEELEDYRVEA